MGLSAGKLFVGHKMKYKMSFAQYQQCQKMSKNEFNRWIIKFYQTAYDDGYQDALEKIPDDAVIIDRFENIIIEWSQEEFSQMLQSIKGIGPTLAEKIIQCICSRYDTLDISETAEDSLGDV